MLHKEYERSLVGGHMIYTVFTIGIVLRTCPLAGGSFVLFVPLMYSMGVNVG